jgi:hypothetical protein
MKTTESPGEQVFLLFHPPQFLVLSHVFLSNVKFLFLDEYNSDDKMQWMLTGLLYVRTQAAQS